MVKRMFEKIVGIGSVVCLAIMFCGCAMLDTSDKKIAQLEFEVVDMAELPEEIQTMIEERKNEAFQMAYHDENHSYIIVGYGMQDTSGYSIQVNDVYQGEDSIWVDTDLVGPEKSEKVESVPSYPYVIIRTEVIDQTIRFKN